MLISFCICFHFSRWLFYKFAMRARHGQSPITSFVSPSLDVGADHYRRTHAIKGDTWKQKEIKDDDSCFGFLRGSGYHFFCFRFNSKIGPVVVLAKSFSKHDKRPIWEIPYFLWLFLTSFFVVMAIFGGKSLRLGLGPSWLAKNQESRLYFTDAS